MARSARACHCATGIAVRAGSTLFSRVATLARGATLVFVDRRGAVVVSAISAKSPSPRTAVDKPQTQRCRSAGYLMDERYSKHFKIALVYPRKLRNGFKRSLTTADRPVCDRSARNDKGRGLTRLTPCYIPPHRIEPRSVSMRPKVVNGVLPCLVTLPDLATSRVLRLSRRGLCWVSTRRRRRTGWRW